jgi:GntR family transcriptional repressor for pyruvate dehydrogenase complex
VLTLDGLPHRQLTRAFELSLREAPPAPGDLRHIQELRVAVEGATAELAARRRTRADLVAIRGELALMAAAIERGSDASDADGRFHAHIARATQNPYLYRFVALLDRPFAETRRPGWDPARHRAGTPRAAHQEHQQLLAAIEAGDTRAARAAAVRHLMNAMVRMGWTERLARRPPRPRAG